jgi:hypothetical protein
MPTRAPPLKEHVGVVDIFGGWDSSFDWVMGGAGLIERSRLNR